MVKSDAELALSVKFVGLVPLLYNYKDTSKKQKQTNKQKKKMLREFHHAKSYDSND